MTRARPLVAATAVLGALTLAVTLGYIGGRVSRPHRSVPVSADTFAVTWSPQSSEGKAAYLAAGGADGGSAITYLKFKIDLPGGTPPALAELWLARHSGPLPELVELTQVPSTIWDEARLTAATAPRLGAVVGSIAPRGYESALRFDVTKVIRKSGTYAFAVTAPTGASIARFIARDDLVAAKAPTITISFDPAAAASARSSASSVSSSSGVSSAVSPGGMVATGEPYPSMPPWPLGTPTSVPTSLPDLPSPPNPTFSMSPLPPELPTTWPPTPSGWPIPDPPSPTGPGTPALSPSPDDPGSPSPSDPGSPSPSEPGLPSPSEPVSPSPSEPGLPSESPSSSPSSSSSESPGSPSPSPSENPDPQCELGKALVPSCGVMWGVAPASHTDVPRRQAVVDFETSTGRRQALFHAYHRGEQLFPTPDEIAIARNAGKPRLLFLSWKPTSFNWAEIARGRADAYLGRLAAHIRANFTDQFFFTMYHEPEDNVVARAGSGMTAKDFANAFRHVVLELRGNGVTNMVTAICYMAYVPWNTQPWFEDLYPGDDVVDWVAWDAYAYSDPGYGHGDFAEMMNRKAASRPSWPGFYNWAAKSFPDKPLMVAEWGVWYSQRNPTHQATFFDSVGKQMELFPRVKAMMYFDTPSQQQGRNSRVDATSGGLRSYRKLGRSPVFEVMPAASRRGSGY